MHGANRLSVTPLVATQAVAGATQDRTATATALLSVPSLPLLTGPDTAPVSLSAAARLIASVLGAAQQALPSSAAVTRVAPLLPAASAEPAVLEAALRHAVDSSGLFYESHVAEWVHGMRTLSELGAEPQQQAAAEGMRPSPTDPATAHFISMQLATQEQAQLCWQGKLWPGQPIELEVRREPHEGGAEHQGPGDGTAWHSRLRLRFPMLGELDAHLSLTRDGVRLQLAAGNADSAELLRRQLGRLALSLEAAGTPLSGMEIRSGGAGE